MKEQNNYIQLYHFEPQVRVLGPGLRSVIWVQGCYLKCKNCIVPDSHSIEYGEKIEIEKLVGLILSNNIEGITISGGEPFLQKEAIYSLITNLKKQKPELSIFIFTGFVYNKLLADHSSITQAILKYTDILVDGPFIEEKYINDPWRGSSNQEIHFLSDRYSLNDHKKTPTNQLEFFINSNKNIFIAGIPPEPDFMDKFNDRLKIKGVV